MGFSRGRKIYLILHLPLSGNFTDILKRSLHLILVVEWDVSSLIYIIRDIGIRVPPHWWLKDSSHE